MLAHLLLCKVHTCSARPRTLSFDKSGRLLWGWGRCGVGVGILNRCVDLAGRRVWRPAGVAHAAQAILLVQYDIHIPAS